jgi:hypothetical protein
MSADTFNDDKSGYDNDATMTMMYAERTYYDKILLINVL